MSCVCAWSFAAGDSEARACSGLQRVKLYAACCVVDVVCCHYGGARAPSRQGQWRAVRARSSPRHRASAQRVCRRTGRAMTAARRSMAAATAAQCSKLPQSKSLRTWWDCRAPPGTIRRTMMHGAAQSSAAMSRAAASAAIPCVPRVVYSKLDVAFRMPCRQRLHSAAARFVLRLQHVTSP